MLKSPCHGLGRSRQDMQFVAETVPPQEAVVVQACACSTAALQVKSLHSRPVAVLPRTPQFFVRFGPPMSAEDLTHDAPSVLVESRRLIDDVLERREKLQPAPDHVAPDTPFWRVPAKLRNKKPPKWQSKSEEDQLLLLKLRLTPVLSERSHERSMTARGRRRGHQAQRYRGGHGAAPGHREPPPEACWPGRAALPGQSNLQAAGGFD